MSSTATLSRIQLDIRSEFDPLKVVLVHRPGDELDRLTPGNMEEFLLEDIPYLTRMQEEHDQFCDVMRRHGTQVLYLKDLVADIVRDPQAKFRLVIESCDLSGNPGIAGMILDKFSDEQIVAMILNGLSEREFHAITGGNVPSKDTPEKFLINPSPNSYFTRDPAVVFGDGVISCNAYYPVRVRETAVMLAVMQLHPYFRGAEILFGDTDEEDQPLTIEGGDIIVLNKNALAVGKSERTRREAIEILSAKLIRAGRAERVYEIAIPPERVYMHLDTVFTIVGPRTVVMYPFIFGQQPAIRRIEAGFDSTGSRTIHAQKEERSFEDILSDELGGPIDIVRVGDNDLRYSAREQHSAGSNTLAIAPNKVISYERNEHTNRALKAAGVEVFEIEGGELVRGLGGPRCMSMPLRREK